MKRRRLLAGLGAASVSGFFAGCNEEDDATPSPTDDEVSKRTTTAKDSAGENWLTKIQREWGFDRIVNLEKRGVDTGGDSPIDDVINDVIDDGTLIYLPEGRYRIDDSIAADGISRLGIVGDGATIVPPDGFDQTILGLGWPNPGNVLLVEGIDFDFSADETGGRPILGKASDRVVLRDITVNGIADVDQDLVRIDVTGEDGTGLVERLMLPDGSDPDLKNNGCSVGDDNRGDLFFVDCHIEGFPDNGLYADPPVGSVAVHGGSYFNNGVAGVRIESSEESLVRGVHVRCDRDEGGDNMRGIRLRAGSETVVEDCVVELMEVTSSDGAIVFSPELAAGTVRNCQVRVDADDINAIRIKSPNDDTPDDTGPFRFENIVITGNASGRSAIDAANRADCIFENICLHQTGDDRDGFVFHNADGKVLDSYVSVTGRPFRFRNSDITRRNVSVNRTPNTTALSSVDSCK